MQTFFWMALAGNLAAFAARTYQYYRWHVLYALGRISQDQYYEVFNEYPLHLYSFRADRDVVEYLKRHARPGASIRTVGGGGDTMIHYLSGMHSPTRFTSTWYLFSTGLFADTLTIRLREEFFDAVMQAKPDYILFVYYSPEELREYTAGDPGVCRFLDYVDANYILEKEFRDGRMLLRKV